MGRNYTRIRKGFTVIEVVLFFAISGLLIVGLLLGMTNSIARQRYQDSVQDLADFLKTQYYAVSNPSIPEWTGLDLIDYRAAAASPDPRQCGFRDTITDINSIPVGTTRRGQSRCQLYGKLIVFGEDPTNPDRANIVNTYLVVGMDGRSGPLINDPRQDLMMSDIFIPGLNLSDSYALQYSATAENVANADAIEAAILIVRPPRSGGVNTLIADFSASGGAIINPGVTATWTTLFGNGDDPARVFFPNTIFNTTNGFRVDRDLDICIGSYDVSVSGPGRRQIRIKGGSGNASGVEVLSEGESTCS